MLRTSIGIRALLLTLLPVFILATGNFPSGVLSADIRLPGFFGDHMVLQQQMPIKVWGWGDASEKVVVTLGNDSVSTACDKNGKWRIELPSRKASNEPLTLTVKGNNTIELKDVLIGEVWLCSGQSNMEWSVARSANPEEEIANANHPLIRHIKFARRPSATPQDDIQSSWQVCSPKTVSNFTAVGYYTAVNLHRELKIPIGLINSSWGGTRVEPWTPLSGFKSVPALEDLFKSTEMRTPGTESHAAQVNAHRQAVATWLVESQKAVESSSLVQPHAAFPARLAPLTGRQDPTALYNGMIHALVGLPIRGALWYQGESNHAEGMLYFHKKKALIEGWRNLWGQGDFPFYFVQIAPFQYGNEAPEILAEFWEAQTATLQLPNTGMVVTNDITNLRDIHPKNKQDIGKRLAMLALRNQYGRKDLVANSPSPETLVASDQQLRIKFKDAGGGLKTRDGKAPTHFEIIGAGSNGFQPAQAQIDGDTVVLTSDAVAKPTAFRFAWNKTAEPNLIGGTGLPVGAVRGGQVPAFLDTISEDDSYQLVYDLDLSKLSRPAKYDIDQSSQVGAFDRIGYLVELESDVYGSQKVFVSMDAFTDDVKKIGIPVNDVFQQSVTGVNVYSNVRGIVKGQDLPAANIEFWPHNYAPTNAPRVKGAAGNKYDFGDQITNINPGYGSMQVHNTSAKQTVFAINNWNSGPQADIGIGNSTGDNPDWTFSQSAKKYSSKRLRVYVRPKK